MRAAETQIFCLFLPSIGLSQNIVDPPQDPPFLLNAPIFQTPHPKYITQAS